MPADRDRHIRDRAEKLFVGVFALPQPERQSILDARARDPELRAAVDALLQAHDEPVDLLAKAEHGSLDSSAALPQQIGEFRVLDEIGRGGMGVVYRAEQGNPRRLVALKILSSVAPSESAVRRFEREVEVLALLKHPGIAQILAAGTTKTDFGSIPWFALELVEGLDPITYADAHEFDARARCELVARVCDAVQFANERGVVHRDLKPRNVVVTETAPGTMLPKVLDFGVARAIAMDGAGDSFRTMTGELIGTLPYMSPEQFSGDPHAIDRRCDVYALGVMLYQLLTHQLPLDVESRPISEVARIVRDRAPPLLHRHNPAMRGDIEVVLQTALAKEPEQRYPTAAAFAEDLRRWIDGHPVRARRQSAWRQLARFAGRNRAMVLSAATAFAAVVVALVVVTWLATENGALAATEGRLRTEAASATAAARLDQYRAEMNLAGISLNTLGGSQHARATTERWIPGPGEPDLRGFEWDLLRAFGSAVGTAMGTHGAGPVCWSGDGTQVRFYSRENLCYDVVTGRRCAASEQLRVPPRQRRLVWVDRTTAQIIDLESGALSAINIGIWPSASGGDRSGERFAVMEEKHRELHLFDLPSARELGMVKLPGQPAFSLDFSPDGAYLAATIHDLGLSIVRAEPLEVLRTVAVPASALRFSPDGRQLAGAGADGTVYVIDVASGAVLHRFAGHEAFVSSVDWSPCGRFVVSGSHDRTLRLWQPRSDGSVKMQILGVAPADIVCVSWDPTGQRIASTDCLGELRVWDATGRAPLRLMSAAAATQLEFARGRPELIVANDGKVHIWSADTFELLDELPGRIWRQSSDGQYEAILDGHTVTVRRCADRTVTVQHVFAGRLQHDADWSPTGHELLVATLGDDTPEQRAIWCWAPLSGAAPRQVCGMGPFFCMRWHPDGQSFLLHGMSAKLTRLSVVDGTILRDIVPGGFQGTFAMDRTRSRLCLGTRLGDLMVYDADLAVRSLRVVAHAAKVLGVAWSPDGQRLASAADDRQVRLWDTGSGTALLTLPHPGNATHLAWSPDGRLFASAARDGYVRVWDTREVVR